MNNHMSLKLVGANSSLELNSPITSIYLQEELTGLTTLPGIRETKGMNIGMDGGWTSAQFYEPRLITIKGVIANQDVAVVEQRRKQLIQLLAEKRLALEFQTEAGNHYTMNVVVAGVQMPLSKVLTASYFQLSLRADDPLIYDNNALAELEAILRRSSSASSGFSINFPINFQLGVSESRPTIDNFGSSVIYPVITLTGPLTTPEIVNITTNMAFTIDEVLGAGTYTASGIRGAMTQEGSVDTYSGNPVQATRDAESPISKFSLYGDASQTTYSGKNLYNYSAHPVTGGGITWTLSDDGLFTITGTLTTSYQNIQSQTNMTDLLEDGQTYTLSMTANSATAYAYPMLTRHNIPNNTNEYLGIKPSQPLTFTVDKSTFTYLVNVQATTTAIWGNTNRTFTMTAQLEKGSSPTSFEKYVGGTASPNPDYPQPISVVTGENVVKIGGKNLFSGDFSQFDSVGGDGTLYTYFELPTDGDYMLTLVAKNEMPTQSNSRYIGFSSTGGGASGGSILWAYSGTAGSTAGQSRSIPNYVAGGGKLKYLSLYPKTQATLEWFTENFDIQLELGSTATAYEPYQGQEFEVNLGSIELAKIGDYQDKIYKTGGKWYIEKQVGKVVLDGTETGWGWADTARYTITTSNIGAREAISDHFTYVNYTGHATTASPSFDISSNLASIGFHDKDITGLNNFKTWLASNPTIVYYALATPTTTEITNEALIDQLDAILEAHLYEGLNNISNVAISPNLAGDLEIKTGQTLTVISALSIVGSSGTAEIDLGGAELAMVGSVADELTINGTTGAVTKTTRIGKIASYAGETITTDYISTSGGLDSDATIYYVLPSSSTSVINTLDSTALTTFNNVVASGGVSAQTNIGSISVDVATVTAQDVAVVDTKQHTVTINGVGAYSKFSGDWLTLDVGLNELQLITENNTDTGSAVIKYRVGYMGV